MFVDAQLWAKLLWANSTWASYSTHTIVVISRVILGMFVSYCTIPLVGTASPKVIVQMGVDCFGNRFAIRRACKLMLPLTHLISVDLCRRATTIGQHASMLIPMRRLAEDPWLSTGTAQSSVWTCCTSPLANKETVAIWLIQYLSTGCIPTSKSCVAMAAPLLTWSTVVDYLAGQQLVPARLG